MQNIDKPNAGVPQTELNIGSGFNLIVGSTFKLIVGALGLGGMTNSAKASIGETWGSITATYADETRTWEEASQLISNSAKAIQGAIWVAARYPWKESSPWLDAGVITNKAKP